MKTARSIADRADVEQKSLRGVQRTSQAPTDYKCASTFVNTAFVGCATALVPRPMPQ